MSLNLIYVLSINSHEDKIDKNSKTYTALHGNFMRERIKHLELRDKLT